MAPLTTPISSPNTRLTVGGNGTSAVRPQLDFCEDLSGVFLSLYAWHTEPPETKSHQGFDEGPALWTSGFDKDICICAAGSRPITHQSNTPLGISDLVSTESLTLANEVCIFTNTEIEELSLSLVDEALVSKWVSVGIWPFRNRYLTPQTPVSERIDQLILDEGDNKELLLDRQQQAEWLKLIMATHWGLHLPQPFIGFDLDEGFFIASWQSDSECNTLTIDAGNHKGWYDAWPAEEGDNPLADEIDLDSEAEWRCLRIALTTNQS